MNSASRRFLCRLDELDDPGTVARSLALGGEDAQVLLVRSQQQVYAYLNRCPHTGVALDWTPGRFLSADQRHLQCATHAALFRFEDGFCVSGPCAGERLRALPLEIDAGKIYLLVDRHEKPDSVC